MGKKDLAAAVGRSLESGLLVFCAYTAAACSSAPEEAAYLLNALATDATMVAGEYELPEEMQCGDRKYTYNGGTFNFGFTLGADDVDLVIDADIDARGPDVFSISYEGGEENPSFVCNVNASWELDADTNKPTGKGEVIDCEDYKCEVNGIKVTCDELKAALPKFGCD